MKSIILAGGYATRLLPVTKHIPKPLLPVDGKPIIDYIIDELEQIDEIDEIVISTNKKFEKNFRYWMSKLNTSKKLDLIVEPTKSENEKFGSIKAIEYIINKKGLNDDCLIVGGDNLFMFKLKDFVNHFKNKRAPHVALYDIGDIEKAKRFGVMKVNKDHIVELFEEKPEHPKSTLVSTACYIFPKEVLPLFNKYVNNGYNKDSPGFFIQWLYKKTNIVGYPFSGYWFDIGTIDAYTECVNFFEKMGDANS